jgi:hypothetical protein
LIKGWSLTVAAALLAFTAKEASWKVALIPLVPLTAFWLLDGYFIRQERLFRILYDESRKSETSVDVFSMDVRAFSEMVPLKKAILSPALTLFYGGLFMAQLVVTAAIALSGHSIA